ncbi:MAG: sigma-70 family RNA polymerase sigma factor [Eudoraea sp.]|nr:sigma-70 family RNA polymerase sigma factor [Eudoraea sp.]
MQDQTKVVENIFRSEYGKIMAILVNRFGPAYLEKIEDAIQDALLKAMQVWGYKNVPENPTSWLLRVAGNGLIDTLRRDKKVILKEEGLNLDLGATREELVLENTISDSQLKMIFACCHPALSQEYQIVLSLKLIGGFGNREIAKVLLKKEDAIAKSFTRAKRKLKQNISTLDIPVEIGLQSRLFVVIRVIYLLFSEGYAPSSGDLIVRKDVCFEAIRLALLLNENEYCKHPDLDALIALMCFHVSRFDARLDKNREMIDLENQDRSKYNRKLIQIGIKHLEIAGKGAGQPSNYHLEAAVSFYHCVAGSFEETDWKRILYLYDLQLERQFSPIVQLNRIIPYYKVYGAKEALKELKQYKLGPYFKANKLYHAIQAELFVQLNSLKEAMDALTSAIALTDNALEKKHLSKKLAILKQQNSFSS